LRLRQRGRLGGARCALVPKSASRAPLTCWRYKALDPARPSEPAMPCSCVFSKSHGAPDRWASSPA